MAPSTAVRQTCCCFNVRIATTALAIYHVVSVGRPRAAEGVCVCVREGGGTGFLSPPAGQPLDGRCSPPFCGLLLGCQPPALSKGGRGPCRSRLSRTMVEGGVLVTRSRNSHSPRSSVSPSVKWDRKAATRSTGCERTPEGKVLWEPGLLGEAGAGTAARTWGQAQAWPALPRHRAGQQAGISLCAPHGRKEGVLFVYSSASHCLLLRKHVALC